MDKILNNNGDINLPVYVRNFLGLSYADKEAWFDKRGFVYLNHAPIAKVLFELLCGAITEFDQKKAGAYITIMDFFDYVLNRINIINTPHFPKTRESLRPFLIEFLENMKRYRFCDWVYLPDKYNMKIWLLPEPEVFVKDMAEQAKPEKLIEKVIKVLNQEWELVAKNTSYPLPNLKDVAAALHLDSDKLLTQMGEQLQRLDISDFNRTLLEKSYKDIILLYFNLTEFDPKTNSSTKKHYCEPVMLTKIQYKNLYEKAKSRIDGYIKEFGSDTKRSFDLEAINKNLKNLYPSEEFNLRSAIQTDYSDRLRYFDIWTSVYHILLSNIFPRYKASPWQISGIQASVLMIAWFSFEKDGEMLKIERKQVADIIRSLFEAGDRVVLRREILGYCEHYINRHGLAGCEEIILEELKVKDIEKYLKEPERIDNDEFLKIITRFRPGQDDEYYILNSSIIKVFNGQITAAKSRDLDNPGFYLKYMLNPWKSHLFTDLYAAIPDVNLRQTGMVLRDNRRFLDYIKKMLPEAYPVLSDIYRYFETNPEWLKKICAIQNIYISESSGNGCSLPPLWTLLGLNRSEIIHDLYNGKGVYFFWKLLNSWIHSLFGKRIPRNLLDIVVEEEKIFLMKKKKQNNTVQKNVSQAVNEPDKQDKEKKTGEEIKERYNKNYKKICDIYFKGRKEAEYPALLEACLDDWNIRPAMKDRKEREIQENKDKMEIDNQIRRYFQILRNDFTEETVYAVMEDIMDHPPAENVVRQKSLRQYIMLSFLIQLKPGN